MLNDYIGLRILTPDGVETITSIDDARDLVRTDHGEEWKLEDVRDNTPPPGATEIERMAWLRAPECILIQSYPVYCTCTCGTAQKCYHLVTVHGSRKQSTHMQNTGCTCGNQRECCGFPLTRRSIAS